MGVVRNEFYDQLAAAVRQFAPLDDEMCERIVDALYRSYWQGWNDGMEEQSEPQPAGASGRGLIAALPAFRVVQAGTVGDAA